MGYPFDLRDRFETRDGSRPNTPGLAEAIASKFPLSAISVLKGGDVFESIRHRADPEAQALVERWLQRHVTITGRVHPNFSDDATRLLGNNSALVNRLLAAKPLHVTFLATQEQLRDRNLPRALRTNAAGLYWDHPTWSHARIFYRSEHVDSEPALIAHELGHAVHYLALADEERSLTYQALKATFGSRAAMDEVFAIYTEREFLTVSFGEQSLDGPGIYGAIRRQWSEDHVFTRFIRKLYFPHRPLAGPQLRGWL